MADEEGFSGPQVCDIVGITYRQLDYWDRTDLLKPSLQTAQGSGTQRRYSYRDLVQLKVIKSLLDAGVKLQNARRAVESLRTDRGQDWQTASLVLDGANTVLTMDEAGLFDVLRGGQRVLNVVPIGHMQAEVDARIVELHRDPPVPIATSTPGVAPPLRERIVGEG
jgi:DNA-binding transcriptional MerR regulator